MESILFRIFGLDFRYRDFISFKRKEILALVNGDAVYRGDSLSTLEAIAFSLRMADDGNERQCNRGLKVFVRKALGDVEYGAITMREVNLPEEQGIVIVEIDRVLDGDRIECGRGGRS